SRPAGPGSGPVRLGARLHFAGGGCKILRAPAGRRGILMALAGVDVGGTFTDFIVLDGSGSPGMRFFKVPSTPRRPGQSVLDALEKSGLDPQAIQKFVHGTTVATNTVLERAGAKVGLLTTKGFEDVLEIQRID